MSELLTDLLAAGAIDKLDGDDTRFAKMERAAASVAATLGDHPPTLIRAILAGLDPDIAADDPSILQAELALVAEWKSMSSVHTDKPIGLLRAILLEACSQVARGKNAAILWMTAADTFPLLRLGKEEPSVRRMLMAVAEEAERAPLTSTELATFKKPKVLKVDVPESFPVARLRKVDREKLLKSVSAAAGPNYMNQKAQPGANPHWPAQRNGAIPQWSWVFSDHMRDLLANELDDLAAQVNNELSTSSQQIHIAQQELAKSVQAVLTNQRRWVNSEVQTAVANQRAEQVRLNSLWWAEAFYSPTLRCGYRDLPPNLASVAMAFDLLDVVSLPTPSSVGYLLAETVGRLPGVGFDQRPALLGVLQSLREDRGHLPKDWADRFSLPPTEGRISLRDLLVLAISDREWLAEDAIRSAGLDTDASLSLPLLARALFRQEQAVRLAEAGP